MAGRTWRSEVDRQCSKCGAPTDRLDYDPVTGTVGIPVCPRCARSGVRRLFLLLVALAAFALWLM
jgi:hypothetical protein